MERERQYLRPRVGGSATSMSDGRAAASRPAEWPEWEPERKRDGQAEQPVKSILRKTARPSTRPRRNSDTSVTSSNTPAVGSESELGSLRSPAPLPSASTGTLPRRVLKAKFPGIPQERQGVVNLRPSRSSSSSIPSSYHVPPVNTVLAPQYLPDSRLLDRHDRREPSDRHERRDYLAQDPETESVSESSDLSSTTQATTVVSASSDSGASDVTPTETNTKSAPSVRFTPSVIGSGSSVASSIPPSRIVKPRLGIRGRPSSETDRTVAKSGTRTGSVKLLPSSVTTSESRCHRWELEKTQQELERSLRHRIEQLEAETRALREREAVLQKDLDESAARLASAGQEKAAIEKERDVERSNREEVLGMLEQQKAIFDEFRSNFELQKVMLDEAEKERDAERASKVELQAKLDATKQVFDEFRSTLELQKVMIMEAEKERDEVKASRDRVEDRFAQLEKDFHKLQEDRKEHEDLLAHQITALEVSRDALKEQRDNKEKEIADMAADRERLKMELETLAARVAAFDDEKKAAEEEQRKIKDAAEEEKAALRREAEESQQTLKTRVEELQQEKEGLENAKATGEQEKVEVQTKLETAQGEITKLSLQIEELTSSASDLNARITNLEEQLSTAQADASNLRSQIENLESEKASLQKQIEDLDVNKAEMQEQIHALETDLAGAKAANVSLASQKLDLAGDMAGVKEALDTATAEIERLTQEKSAVQAEADKVAGLEAAKTELDAKVTELEGKVSELEGKIAELQVEADKVSGLSGEKEAAESKISELEGKAAELEAKLAEAQAEAGKLPALEAAKTELEGKVAELQAKISELQAELDKDPDAAAAALRAELAAKGQEITRRVEEINALTEGNSALSAQLGATRQQLDTVQQSLDNVTQSYNDATGQVIELQQRVEQLASASRRASRSRTSSPQKKDRDGSSGGKKDKQLVVVRNPADRGALSVMLQIAAAI
ncbi:hypothetical protein VTK56DRAFT_6694 [Thermocarpiscus australiensis]